jgi:Uma2 family endonuclease
MLPSLTIPVRPSRRGEPVWELLELLPEQGEWSEEAYLRLNTNRLVEFNDGCLEVLPMPDAVHQLLAWLLTTALNELLVDGKAGVAIPAPFKLKVPGRKWREPDVSYLLPRNLHRYQKQWWDYTDLAIEVVSEDDPDRDYVQKRAEYAALGVGEYWIVDPSEQAIKVLVLEGGSYKDVQIAGIGDTARPTIVPGFQVDVAALFARARAHEPQ